MTTPSNAPVPTRVLGPRRSLPGSRAVVGGLLVTVAILGTWWAGTRSDRAPTTRYLVAARTVAPGQRLVAGDLASVAIELPSTVAGGAFSDPEVLVGAVATGPIGAGELIQAGAVAAGSGPDRARELSFVVDPDWAVAGTLEAGDRIDLWVTYGSGAEADTVLVVRHATVRRVASEGDQGLGARSEQTLTVALPALDDVRAATNAARAGEVTVTRSTDADEGEAEAADADAEAEEPASTTTTTRPAGRTTTTTRRAGG